MRLDWPESIKDMQRNWIGRSEGAEVTFAIDGHDEDSSLYSRLALIRCLVRHMPFLLQNIHLCKIYYSRCQKEEVEDYLDQIKAKSDLERTDLAKEKTGVFTGAYAINPANGEKMPIWIADYVLMSYGTGASWPFRHMMKETTNLRKFELPIKEVVAGGNIEQEAYTGDGVHVNSEFLDGIGKEEAIAKMIQWLEEKEIGKKKITFRLRDWLFSRQRYWGEPIPIIHWEDGTTSAVPEDQLPIMLPKTDNIKPSGTGESPLANIADWVNIVDPETGKKGRRETNTMPQWAGSCWYYLRYIDPK